MLILWNYYLMVSQAWFWMLLAEMRNTVLFWVFGHISFVVFADIGNMTWTDSLHRAFRLPSITKYCAQQAHQPCTKSTVIGTRDMEENRDNIFRLEVDVTNPLTQLAAAQYWKLSFVRISLWDPEYCFP